MFLHNLKEREKFRQWKMSHLDPRNASRTPSANKVNNSIVLSCGLFKTELVYRNRRCVCVTRAQSMHHHLVSRITRDLLITRSRNWTGNRIIVLHLADPLALYPPIMVLSKTNNDVTNFLLFVNKRMQFGFNRPSRPLFKILHFCNSHFVARSLTWRKAF